MELLSCFLTPYLHREPLTVSHRPWGGSRGPPSVLKTQYFDLDGDLMTFSGATKWPSGAGRVGEVMLQVQLRRGEVKAEGKTSEAPGL